MAENINFAGADNSAPEFVLREITTQDVFQMIRVLRSIGIQAVMQELSGIIAKATWKRPEKIVNGERVPIPDEELTEGQLRSKEQAQQAQEEASMSIIGYLIDHIDTCESELVKLIAAGYGVETSTIIGMRGVDFLDLLDRYVSREGFTDFLKAALRLLQRLDGSRS